MPQGSGILFITDWLAAGKFTPPDPIESWYSIGTRSTFTATDTDRLSLGALYRQIRVSPPRWGRRLGPDSHR